MVKAETMSCIECPVDNRQWVNQEMVSKGLMKRDWSKLVSKTPGVVHMLLKVIFKKF